MASVGKKEFPLIVPSSGFIANLEVWGSSLAPAPFEALGEALAMCSKVICFCRIRKANSCLILTMMYSNIL